MVAKYVVFEYGGNEIPVIWPALVGIHHVEVESRLATIGWRGVSAGFCVPAAGWKCRGESLTTGLQCRPEIDQAVMRQCFANIAPPNTNDGLRPQQPAHFPSHD